MDKKQLKKLIRSEFKDIFDTQHFVRESETLFYRITESNVMQIINFDLGSIGFTCTVALQPLYVFEYASGFDLTFGKRLSRFKIVQREWWPYEEPERGIREIKELLLENGLPWFEEYGTPEGIVKFISNNIFKKYGFVAFDSFFQKQILGFSLLYLGRLDEGIESIEDVISEITATATPLLLLYKQQLIELVGTIKSQPKKTPGILKAYIEENKKGLKLK